MHLTNKTILLISPERWDHIFVSKHHYAIHLAGRGNKVYFVEPPGRETGVSKSEFANLYLVKYTGFPKGLRFFPSVLQKRIFLNAFRRIESLCGVSFEIVWSFDNSVFFDLSALPAGVFKIAHIVDLNQNFQVGKSARTADCCFCTTGLIKDRLLKYNLNVFKITHGFNQSFQREADTSIMTGRIKVVYAGNLSMPYIDWFLLDTVTAENPQADFYFIGPGQMPAGPQKMNVINRSNTHFPGKVEASGLQVFYSKADVLLIAYQEEFHNEQANPHKMMEYLGSGKMIVATFSAEYAEVANGIFMMTTRNRDFPEAFCRVLGRLDHWNGINLQNARRSIALDNTYERQIERIERLISRL